MPAIGREVFVGGRERRPRASRDSRREAGSTCSSNRAHFQHRGHEQLVEVGRAEVDVALLPATPARPVPAATRPSRRGCPAKTTSRTCRRRSPCRRRRRTTGGSGCRRRSSAARDRRRLRSRKSVAGRAQRRTISTSAARRGRQGDAASGCRNRSSRRTALTRSNSPVRRRRASSSSTASGIMPSVVARHADRPHAQIASVPRKRSSSGPHRGRCRPGRKGCR